MTWSNLDRWKLMLLAIALAIVLTALPGCAGNPVAEASTVEQKAYALYGTFVIMEEQAARIVQDPVVPEDTKRLLREADAVAKPAADELLAATQSVIVIRRQLAAGTTTDEKLQIANANLLKWYTDSAPRIEALVRAVQGVR